jgi:hypothetical protein
VIDAGPSNQCDDQSDWKILAVLRRAFELAGVEFIDENGGGLGVRLWHRQQISGQAQWRNPLDTQLLENILAHPMSFSCLCDCRMNA